MERKTVIALVLSLLVIVAWNLWYYNRYKDVIAENKLKQLSAKTDTVESSSASSLSVEKDATSASPKKPAIPLAQVDPTVDPTKASPLTPATAKPTDGKTVTIDTGVMVVRLTSLGGLIESWKLSHYISEEEENQPIELVVNDSQYLPLTLEFATPEATRKVNSSLFATDAPASITLTESAPAYTVVFSTVLESGFNLVKKITFNRNSYRADMEIGLSHPSVATAGSSFSIGWYGIGQNINSGYSYNGPVAYIDGERKAKSPDEDEDETYEGNVDWAGLSNKYYCVGFFPAEKATKVIYRQIKEKVYSTSVRLAVGADGAPASVALYGGPKTVKDLKEQGNEFIQIINYGWLDVISKPIYRLMVWVNSKTGNFGWAIILVTVLIKVLFFPLTQKSFKSMSKMRKLQPQMKILQDRYKDNKQKMNEELIALYRKHKLNPMSGCFPILLQIPVFIALYKVLLESIELKGAPFIFWLHDLSAKDPYYITPILMGLSMFVQQKLSPQANDPIQRNMMLIMPVVFTVMFINFPSGLVVYWLVNNLLSIVQQWLVNRNVEA